VFRRVLTIVVTVLFALAGAANLLAAYHRNAAVLAAAQDDATSPGPPVLVLIVLGVGFLAIAAATPWLLAGTRIPPRPATR